jgi:hypothetical protein
MLISDLAWSGLARASNELASIGPDQYKTL